jgi:hypothetical protein
LSLLAFASAGHVVLAFKLPQTQSYVHCLLSIQQVGVP